MFDLRALRYFVAAYEEGSVTSAAKRCFISQPSVSNAIANLEHELSARLFDRVRTGLVATDDGCRLYPLATRLLAEAAAVTEAFGRARRELKLHLQADIHMQQVAAVAKSIQLARPEIQLRLTQEDTGADLRLVSAQEVRPDEWAESLWEDEYVAALPTSHRLSSRETFSMHDLDGADFIERPTCLMNMSFRHLLARQNIRPVVRAAAEREEAVASLVAIGVGVAILPRSHCSGSEGITVLPIDSEASNARRVCLCSPLASPSMVELAKEVGRTVVTPPGMSRVQPQLR